jgi:DNA polymerase IV
MDAFYAAVEQRDKPELRGKPIVVGGDPFSRGVVSTASYEARKFGIRSAMPASHARKLCPQAIFLRPNFRKYAAVSEDVMKILRQHTNLVEPASLDEAYLDVTQHRYGLTDPVMIASMIKQNIRVVTQLTASAGVAPNLFLAKVASDFNKPDGLTVVAPDKIESFLKDLPVRKIPGVGPVTEAALHKINLKTCGDIAAMDARLLRHHFGKTGIFLHERAHGRDDREVEPGVPSKQYSSEETFSKDLTDVRILKSKLQDLAIEIYEGLKEEGRMGKTIVLKVKYDDFELITRSQTLTHPPADSSQVFEVAAQLLEKKTEAGARPIRLIGLGISGLRDLREFKISKERDLFDLTLM